MSSINIQIYDQFSKKIKQLDISDSQPVSQVCQLLDPKFKEKMLTLYLGEKALNWTSTFKYIEEKYQFNTSKMLLFNFIYYSSQEVQRRLQKNEFQLKQIVEKGQLKAYPKEDNEFFRANEVHQFIQQEMEKVTMRFTPDTTRRLREQYKKQMDS